MILTTLNAALSSGLAIGGFPIESVSLTAVEIDANGNPVQVYSSDADAKKYRDIAIIVGVVIPVGLSKFLFNFQSLSSLSSSFFTKRESSALMSQLKFVMPPWMN